MTLKVLIVDDSRDQLMFLTTVFKMVDAQVEVVTRDSGEGALHYLRQGADQLPSVVLLDIRMPGMNGLDVLKELKTDEKLRRIPVCTFSNGDVESDVCEAYASGASFYFRKPAGLEATKKFADSFRHLCFGHGRFCRH